MNGLVDTALSTLADLPASARGAWLREHADESVHHAIGQQLQTLCFTDADEAQSISAWLGDAAEDSGHQPFLCRVLCLRAFVLSVANQFDEAMRTLDQARGLAEDLGDAKSQAGVAQTAVQPLVRLGRYRDAIESAQRAIRLYEEAGDASAVARAHSNLGVVHRMLGQAEQALTHFDRALPGMEADQAATAQVQSNRAEALLDLVDFREAEQAFRAAMSSFQEAGMSRAAAIAGGNLADLLGQQGRLTESMALFERARASFAEGGAVGAAARIESESAEVLGVVGLLDDAFAAAARSSDVLLAHGLRREGGVSGEEETREEEEAQQQEEEEQQQQRRQQRRQQQQRQQHLQHATSPPGGDARARNQSEFHPDRDRRPGLISFILPAQCCARAFSRRRLSC